MPWTDVRETCAEVDLPFGLALVGSEIRLLAGVTRRVHIGDVVADHVEGRLLGLEAR
jgi:hypothetical protein